MHNADAAARRYARGLAECAAANGTLARAVADCRRAADLLDAGSAAYSPDLAAALSSPSAGVDAKAGALEGVLSGLGITEEVRSAFALLVRRGRIGLAARVAAAVEELAASPEFAGAADAPRVAVVRAARPLSPAQEDRLAAALSAKFGRAVRLRCTVDPALLAGAIVTVGEWSLDGTVAGQLDALRRRLVAVSQTAARQVSKVTEDTAS